MPAKITEKSYISIGLVLIFCGAMLGGGAMASQVKSQGEDIDRLQLKVEKVQDQYTQILVGITEIKSELKNRRK